ncbi:MAG: site-specific DNA-methyltransferase [Bacillota bacterium]
MAEIGQYKNQVFCKSCLDMCELPDDSVSLTVTSPPYWNAIDYDRHIHSPGESYRTRQYSVGYVDYGEYLDWLDQVCDEVYRVTKPGGFLAMVIGTVLFQRKHYPVPFDVVSMLTRKGQGARDGSVKEGQDRSKSEYAVGEVGSSGWEFHQDIIWHKVTGGVKRAGVFIQNPYPGYYYPNIMTEYILVFKKPGPPIYTGKTDSEKETSTVSTGRLFTNDIANTVWHIAPVPPGYLDHPCPFPEEIPYRLIQLYSYPGDLVLDPFCGSGQTLKVAKHLGRDYCGYDINQEYVDLAKSRIDEPLSIRKEQLIATFDKI